MFGRAVWASVPLASLLLAGCGGNGTDSGVARPSTYDSTAVEAQTAAAPAWARHVDGRWQVDVDTLTCPETADELYAVVADEEFPVVSQRPGTDQGAWPPGEIAAAVTCYTETSTVGNDVQREPAEGRYPSIVDRFIGGDAPADRTLSQAFAVQTGTGASLTLLDYAEGEDVVVRSWWGSSAAPGSLVEARRAPGFSANGVVVHRNGTVDCRVEHGDGTSAPIRSCAPTGS